MTWRRNDCDHNNSTRADRRAAGFWQFYADRRAISQPPTRPVLPGKNLFDTRLMHRPGQIWLVITAQPDILNNASRIKKPDPRLARGYFSKNIITVHDCRDG
jgi:hypothetical protein